MTTFPVRTCDLPSSALMGAKADAVTARSRQTRELSSVTVQAHSHRAAVPSVPIAAARSWGALEFAAAALVLVLPILAMVAQP